MPVDMQNIRRFLELNLNYYVKGRIPAIIYSMERSGSVALFRSLSMNGEFAVCCHYMDPKKLGKEPQSGSTKWAYKHLVHEHRQLKIISLVRHPIENFLSIFARSEFSKNDIYQQKMADSSEEFTADELSSQFKINYLDKRRHLRQLDWFETEFYETLGVDVFQYPFDQEKGSLQIQHDNLQILIMRTELDDEQKSRLVSNFLGLTNFKMAKAGEKVSTKDSAPGMPGEQTKYGNLYKAFKQKVTLPEQYLDEIFGSRHVQHFFPPDEILAMKDRYRKSTQPC